MITSHIMIPAFFKRNHSLQYYENNSTLIEIATYNFDLGLDVGELINVSNISFIEEDYTFEVRVKSKSKILIGEKENSTLRIEYIVDLVKEEDKEKSFVSSDTDLFLMALVELADKSLLDTNITLFVQGIVVSGKLISEYTYFLGILHETHEKNSLYPDLGDTNKFLGRYMTNYSYRQKSLNHEFIYLEQAKVSFSNSVLLSPNYDGYWRGRLSRIDGFLVENLKNYNLSEYDL
ncbi:hypothetical protein QUB11_03055 [Microcoleus sp. B6-A1]|uniref:hypothetical protein n=1 Tax=Microcoleus sp. B6-A1 TaxID=2818684 RepID=UPI002FD325C7